MLDDFFIRALVAGLGVALVTGPFGCVVLWRRLAYFGDTMAHAALLGVALSLLFRVHVTIGVIAVSAAVALSLFFLERRKLLASDALLGLMSHSALALGLVCLAFMTWVRVDLMAFLFGDILAVAKLDIAVIWLGGAAALLVLARIWRPLLAATVNRDLAEAEGLEGGRADVVFMLLMAVVIAIAMKIVGVLLITAMLIIPAATARRFASGPERMALIAIAAGMAAVAGGLWGSLTWDTPAGPSVVVAALVVFLVGMAVDGLRQMGRRTAIERTHR